MSSYLYDQFKEREKLWESRQADHLHTFQEQKEQEMRSVLKKEQDRLNQLPKSLKDQRENLNTSIGHYNGLLSQWKMAEQEKQNIQEEINKIIQQVKEQEIVAEQVVSLGEDVNAFIRRVNGNILQLTELEVKERKLRHFYNTAKYLQDGSIVDFKTKWDEWKQNQDREYETQAISYNNKVEEFETWKQDQKRSVEDQKTQVKRKQEELDTLVQATNTLILEYNGDIKKRCKTKECEQALLSKKNHIVEEKQKIETEKQIIANLISAVNEQNRNYDEEHQRRTRELDTLKQNTEDLSRHIHEEHARQGQEWSDKIQIQKEKAEEDWEETQQQLNQFRTTLKTGYGDSFSQFVEHLSNWSNINQTAFANLASKSISQQDVERMQESNNILCGNHPDFLPAQVREICSLTKRVAHLLSHISYFDVVLYEWREQLKQKEQRIADLKAELSKLHAVNNQLQFEWDTQLQQHNKKLPEREAQYDLFFEQLRARLNKQIQQIQKAYNKKKQLLTAEYYFISHLLFVLDKAKPDTLLDKKKIDFESARQAFLSSIPKEITSFSSEFRETFELLATILEQGHWSTDISIVPLSFTSNELQAAIKPIEGKQKKQVILSWMRTRVISDFLMIMMDRASDVFSAYKEPDSKKDFVEQMFVKSVYQSLSIRQVVREYLVRYQITYDDRVFWILPKGQLSIPKGFYQ